VEDLLREFAKLIESLAEIAPHAWGVLVRQVVAEGCGSIMWAVVLLVGSAVLYRVGR